MTFHELLARLERILELIKDSEADLGVFAQGRTPGVAVPAVTAARELLEDVLVIMTVPSGSQ